MQREVTIKRDFSLLLKLYAQDHIYKMEQTSWSSGTVSDSCGSLVASHGLRTQTVTVNATGCGFDPDLWNQGKARRLVPPLNKQRLQN